jgi:major vault protein
MNKRPATSALASVGAGGGFVDGDLVKVPPYHYLHVLNLNTNVVRVVEGPCRYTRLDHEKIILGPEPMIVIPPRYFAVIDNPVARDGIAFVFEITTPLLFLREGKGHL